MPNAFHGKAVLLARQQQGPRKRLVTLRHDEPDRRAAPGFSMMLGDGMLGTVTLGADGFRTGLNLALGFVEPVDATPGSWMQVDLLGDLVPAEVIPPCPIDPAMTRPRGWPPAQGLDLPPAGTPT